MEVVTFLAYVGGRETIQSVPYKIRRLAHTGILLSYKSYSSSSIPGLKGGKRKFGGSVKEGDDGRSTVSPS